MQVIKLYLPMKDNNKADLMHFHDWFMDDISDYNHIITGFTRFQAEGFWFDDDKTYKDDIKIYEFHVANKFVDNVYSLLRRKAKSLCRKMSQEAIYLQLNSDTELVRE